MSRIAIVMILVMLSGCAAYQGVGSESWHQVRLQEIEEAYRDGRLNEADYLSLKNETDRIRQDYLLDGVYERGGLRRVSRPYRYR